ncbi:hypothetical protein [Natronomonas sp. LN261]|uniref:hypothetical protein n=1 Tax=Natronomonas sp. LN261 TaxID=2750669 RepID=UPI0015EED83D|nr:hypothetical protein [Natronomonas sp. LN261]
MDFRKLRSMGGGESAGVTLPKDDLRDLGLFEDGELAERYARVERVEDSDSEFLVTVVD